MILSRHVGNDPNPSILDYCSTIQRLDFWKIYGVCNEYMTDPLRSKVILFNMLLCHKIWKHSSSAFLRVIDDSSVF